MLHPTAVVRLLAVGALVLAPVVALPATSAAAGGGPQSATWADAAPHDDGDGYAATLAPLRQMAAVRMPDGDLVVLDDATRTLRRIDSATGIVTSIAGLKTGGTSSCADNLVGSPALDVPLPYIAALSVDPAGRVYVLASYYSYWCQQDAILRLEADGTWSRAAVNPQGQAASTAGYGAFTRMDVGPDGTLYVYDSLKSVVRAYPAGSPTDIAGAVIAGTAGTAGSSGDGGPATSATLSAPGSLVVRAGSLFLTGATSYGDESIVRRVDLASGLITRIAGTGTVPPADQQGTLNDAVGKAALDADLRIRSMAVSADGSTVVLALERTASGSWQHDIVAFSAGGTIRDIRHSLPVDGGCAVASLVVLQSPSRVATCVDSVRTWALDGSQASGVGTAYAGLDETTGRVSPDGVTLDNLYPGQVRDLAVSSGGAVALATSSGLRYSPSLAPSATVTRKGVGPATAVVFSSAQAVVWAEGDADALVRRWTPGGPAPVVVAGGGASALVEGAAATSVELPRVRGLTTATDGDLLMAVESGEPDYGNTGVFYIQVWAVDSVTGLLRLVAGDGGGFGSIAPGDQATALPLGRAFRITTDPGTGRLWIGTEQMIVGIDAGVVAAVDRAWWVHDLSARGDGTLLHGIQLRAPDATWSILPSQSFTASAWMPDGTVLAADDGDVLLRRSSLFTVPTGAPSATVTATPGEGTVDVAVVPPASTGLFVRVDILETRLGQNQNVTTTLGTFTTDGSTTPRSFLADRLTPGRSYWVHVQVTAADGSISRSISAFAVPVPDNSPPPPPSQVVPVNVFGRMTVTPPNVADLDVIAVCLTPAGTSSPDPETCGGWRKTTQPVTYPLAPTTFDVELDTGYDPGVDHVFRVWMVDKQGNLSTPTDVTVPGAAQSATDPGAVAGIVWRSEPSDGKVGVLLGFRSPVSAAMWVVGDQPPARPLPGGGAWSENTFGTGVLVDPGTTVTFGLYRWSEDFSRWTPTYVTVVAGTDARLGAAITAPSTATAGKPVVVTGKVSRLVGSATTGAAQASVPVELWSRTAPSTTWIKVAASSTSATGAVSFSRPALTATTAYQLRVPAQSIYFPAVTTSATATTTLKPFVGASLSSTSTVLAKTIRKGSAVTFTVRTNPARMTTLKIQRKVSGTWTTIVTRTSGSTGRLSWSWTPTSTGTTYWRVVSVATSKQASGTSATLTVKAT